MDREALLKLWSGLLKVWSGPTFVELGAGDLKASIELAKKGGVKVIAVDPVAPDEAAIKQLQVLRGQFVKGVAEDVAPGTADHVFQYFPWIISGTGGGTLGGDVESRR